MVNNSERKQVRQAAYAGLVTMLVGLIGLAAYVFTKTRWLASPSIALMILGSIYSFYAFYLHNRGTTPKQGE